MKTHLLSRLAFKYRSGDPGTLSRDLESLSDATFYAPVRHALNDPFEGRFEKGSLNLQFSELKKLVSSASPQVAFSLDAVSRSAEDVLAYVDKSGVFSLSYNPLQELIWAHYGGSHRGFCIGYDLHKLVEFEPNARYVLDVQYENEAPTIVARDLLTAHSPVTVLQKMLGVKSKPWAYEEEVRVVAQEAGPQEHDYRATKEIYFGMRCTEATMMAVMEVLAGRGVVYRQVVSPQSAYALKTVDIPDSFASAPRYMANYAPIVDGAIYSEGYNSAQRKYASHLAKAAEIVRREPYCKEIQLVDFSADKSNPKEPVIFVQYLRAPNKWVNHYLTPSEIDKQYAVLGLSNDV